MTITVVVGGGFGGIAAANTLRRLVPPSHKIIVVDQSPRFYVGAGKTWMMLGERDYNQISRAREQLLEPGIQWLEAQVQALDLTGRQVVLEREKLSWDYLVIALGADLDMSMVPGLEQAARTFYTVQGAQQLQSELAAFSSGVIVLLIPRVPFKCPPAPYEAAFLMQNAFAQRGLADKVRLEIYTAEGAPMPTAGPEMGAFIKNELASRGIGFNPNKRAAEVDGGSRRIRFEDGSWATYDLLIAVPPHRAPRVVVEAGLTNASGWIPVDPLTLELAGEKKVQGVYAIGDITSLPLPGRFKPEMPLSLPKAGVFAESQGRVAAHQIAAQILGEPTSEVFDGKGFCYLEVGGGRAVRADGSFFELPHPVMYKRVPDETQMREKLDWVAEHLQPFR